MLPEPLPPPLERAPTTAPKEGLAGHRALAVTQAIGLAAAGVLGTVLVIGIPLLLRQQNKVAAALSDPATGAVAQDIARLNMLHWIVLALAAATSICLVVTVLRLLRHAQSQDAVRKEAQALLVRAERARMDADQANADKSRFLAEAGHDLRTPLTTILGYGEMIEREMFGAVGRPAYREAAQQIIGAGRQLLARITDIIELSRVEGSIAKPAEHATSIATVLREAHTWAVATFAPKRLTFGIRMPELDVGIRVQPLLMRQIVRELIKDAAMRTPDGGAIILSVGFGGDGRLDLSIRDTGPNPTLGLGGLPRRTHGQRTLFISRADEAAGMSLMIVRALMDSISGRLAVVNTSGRGSEIHLQFPMHLVMREERRLRRRAVAA
ncbi:sensor histidine kinase [Dongia deserti]|uniref:sensor histidine kinase n=1 Tax=Dongia deserti TaxID=2268030 RepID=UPI000E64BDE8|nr:HAMP domain-containing sensor histidine kinase [Dongia deserti]